MTRAAQTIEAAAAAATGPVMISVLGYGVPVLATILSVLGVLLASMIAPPPPLSLAKRIALIALLVLLVVGLVISDPHRSIVVTTVWSIGIGYTGLPIVQAISRALLNRADQMLDGAIPTGDARERQ